MKTIANVVDRGNGFPGEGDYVPGDDGELYFVTKCGSHIETQACGGGSICLGYELELADWSMLAEDEEPVEALAIL